jgi:hypothetical protein
LAIFQKLANWLDWPCPVSAAPLKPPTGSLFIFYILILIYFSIYESSAWSFGHSDPDPSSVRKTIFSVDIFQQVQFLNCFILQK